LESAARLARFSKAARSAIAHRLPAACRTLIRCAAFRRFTARCATRWPKRAAVFAIELNSATDNPLVFDGEILSGGNFHGEPLAFQLDFWPSRCARWRASPSAASTGW
jgi:hypothetical protein